MTEVFPRGPRWSEAWSHKLFPRLALRRHLRAVLKLGTPNKSQPRYVVISAVEFRRWLGIPNDNDKSAFNRERAYHGSCASLPSTAGLHACRNRRQLSGVRHERRVPPASADGYCISPGSVIALAADRRDSVILRHLRPSPSILLPVQETASLHTIEKRALV